MNDAEDLPGGGETRPSTPREARPTAGSTRAAVRAMTASGHPGRARDLTALVTGGTSGIGAAVARLFVDEGANVTIVARDPERGAGMVAELGAGRCHFVAGDVADEAVAATAVDATLNRYGRLDVLVNNAALDFASPLLDTSRSQFQRVCDVGLGGAFLFLREAGRVMCENRGGSIVNVTSRSATVGVTGMGAYSAAKGGLLALTRTAAIEWAPFGVRVNAVAPGPTNTALLREWIERAPDPAEFEARMRAGVPLQRVAEPEDVARAVLYLASADSRHVTGTSLPVDGGYTAR